MGLFKIRRSQAQHQGFEGRRLLPHQDDYPKDCRAVALVLSGELDKLDDGGKNGQ